MGNSSGVGVTGSPLHVDANVETGARPVPGHRWAELYLIATALMWGINIPVVKYAIGQLDPYVFNAVRLTFAALALSVFASLEVRMSPRSRSAAVHWFPIVIFALLSGVVYQFLFIWGIDRTTAGNAAILLSTMPMWTAVFSFTFLAERLGWISWLGLLITLAGTAVVTLNGGQVDWSSRHMWGNALMLLAAMSWASATVISRPILGSMTPLRLTFIASLITAAIHLAIVWPRLPGAVPTLGKMGLIIAVVYSGAFSTGIAYVTWNTGVRLIGGSHAAVYQALVTLVAVLGGWLALREQVLWSQVLGGIAILGGLMVMRKNRLKQSAAATR